MPNTDLRLIRRSVLPGLLLAVLTCVMCLWSTTAMATITQGDFSVFGSLYTQWSGRWGEGSARNGVPATPSGVASCTSVPCAAEGVAPTETGGSFDFNHWDLVQAKQTADIRPDYHFVKNYNLLGRLDTLVLKDADFFAIYRGWYDAFPDIKHIGRAETARDWLSYNDREKQEQFIRDDLREFYGQLNFTDNFSMRVGKQQVIWSEADALSGTDVTNPSDYRWHWNHFESPEDLRENLRMVKFNYILPDFLKTANNELEFFWIPGDYEHPALIINDTDARSPYDAFAALNSAASWNEEGQPYRNQLFGDAAEFPYTASAGNGYIQGPDAVTTQNRLPNSIDDSEFGARYSSLLPIGNGLQTSLIFLYEAREPKLGFCTNCPTKGAYEAGWGSITPGLGNTPFSHSLPPGTYLYIPALRTAPGMPPNPYPILPGSVPLFEGNAYVYSFLRQENVRQPFIDMTGTYYDKDVTDIVYRYDIEYAPKYAINTFAGKKCGSSGVCSPTPAQSTAEPTFGYYNGLADSKWTEFTRFIVAGDRPTYIPWLSKQHTFITFQNTVTWYPDRPANAVPSFATDVGKVRETSDFFFLAFTNWLMNGQWTALNTWECDVDDNTYALSSTNSYRYSRNVLLGINAIWYLGRSGRYTDPYALSRAQRDNEIEFKFTYEI